MVAKWSKTATYILKTCKWPNKPSVPQSFVELNKFPSTTFSSNNIHRFPAKAKHDTFKYFYDSSAELIF